ncbi:FAD-dependent oxidoreductase [Sedimentibacter sp. MB31-C6]|uniref:FAD-dependent oxidoreductase n=1 Tax=Sedimentibacter sp. MB31-C6 TaxID=3109366 RepID=UPI002DDD02BD|nr:FAD-dependent oxidoreductase [Sedimentibacter sp. MB36-C1]WSI03001.1 FAD-dependent oxidoreductase [Sedimentibacter sp. MB36-C1]
MVYPRNSYWHETATNKKETKYDKKDLIDKKYDLLIIGAGLTGLNTAYLLRNSGYKIAIIEGTNLGYGVSGYTTAKITVQHNLIYDYLINSFSIDEARQYLKANVEGLNLIKNIITENNIQCDYKEQTAYVYTTKENELKILKAELEAYKLLNIDGFYTEDAPLPVKPLGAIGIKNQGQFNPLKYLYSLYNILLDYCEIYENIRAISIEPHSDYHVVKTEEGNIYANKIVVTTHYPFEDNMGLFFLRLYQEKSYVIAAKTDSASFEGMYINPTDPIYSMKYHYDNNDNILILSGANHRAGAKDNEENAYKELETFLKNNFKNPQILSKWSTQDCITYDKIPYIGRYSDNIENIYVATGFKKWGMTHSAAAALILSNKILNIDDDYSEIYNPSRITPLLSSKEFLSSSMYIASGFLKRIKPVPENLFEIEKEKGKIINYNGRKVGVYKNERGELFCINPVCKHMKCGVSFNEAEKTWDCECHGSRFDIRGNILEGPSVYPLDKIKIEKN